MYVNELSTSEHVDAIDLLSGQVHVYFGPILESIEHVRVGKLWPLAVTTAERVETLADIPSLAEFVPGYEASGWHGVGAPVTTPREIVEKLNSEINAALSDPQMRARLIDLGGTELRATSAEFSQLIAGKTAGSSNSLVSSPNSLVAW